MDTSLFHYELPPELIAQAPAPERSAARMLIVTRADGGLAHGRVSDLPELLRPGDLLVVNDTKVIPARVFGRKETGGRIEALLLEERGAAPTAEGNAGIGRSAHKHESTWEVMLKASRPPRIGSCLELAAGLIGAEVLALPGAGRALLLLRHDLPLADILDREGAAPLPPYIKRPGGARSAADRERYQTVYARAPGAVAAPTAGLHFTAELLDRLLRCGVGRAAVTLHVGPGTFVPVTSAAVEEHRMETERYRVPRETAEAVAETQRRGGRIVAVGSTVVRALETAAAETGAARAGEGRSGLFIYPPFDFRVIGALLTNFHLPASTLLMMVSAFAGRELIMRAYAEAIRERYRFYSFGDCMLIL